MNILPFDTDSASLEAVGGKALNLVRLTKAGLTVPPGFIVTTPAYRAFVRHNALEPVIEHALAALNSPDSASLERASDKIRSAFAAGVLPADLSHEVRSAWIALGEAPVAVRSSATAEDLPDLSFAGQQDTFLNVVDADALLKAVVGCWSSLWTARAIGYRARNNIGHEAVALAVVVQVMVPSEVSGVMFTANPLSGALNQTVIEATHGLGEALVSGQVEPDRFVIAPDGRVIEQTTGLKQVLIEGRAGGGVQTTMGNSTRVTLDAQALLQLAGLARRLNHEYGVPQDVEWAIASGRLHVLQARAITSLFPVPQVSFNPLKTWFSFGAVQGVLGPFTPLGRDVIQTIVGGASRLLDPGVDTANMRVFDIAGERLWLDITGILRNPVGLRAFMRGVANIESGVADAVHAVINDPGFAAGSGRVRLRTLARIARLGHQILPAVVRNVLAPQHARARFDRAVDDYLAQSCIDPVPRASREARLQAVVHFIRARIGGAFPFLLPRFVSLLGPSLLALAFLRRVSGERHKVQALEITRGLPHNVTTEMDMALWQTALQLRGDADALDLMQRTDAAALSQLYLGRQLPQSVTTPVERFLAAYGMRGVAEIDFGRPRWREDPTPIFATLKSYIDIPPSHAPDVMFERGAASATEAVRTLAGFVKRGVLGGAKARLVRAASRRLRLMMGARESPKFMLVRLLGQARVALLSVGEEYVAGGVLNRADDLVYLSLKELDALAAGEQHDWRALVAGRRENDAREARRKLVPRLLVSDGRAIFEGVGAGAHPDGAIVGSGVSPGQAEGVVHVVRDPRHAQLAPGDILVCPGTDPAWTPLFMVAGGLITEVGGMMTHGSVVAREYGIPAVVGVQGATQRLKNGQRVRVDGTAGRVLVIE